MSLDRADAIIEGAPTIYSASTCDWPNPGSQEIDISEIFSDSHTSVLQNVYAQSSTATTTDVPQNFHDYKFVWNSTSLTWYIDGVQTCHVTDDASNYVPNTTMYIIMNLSIAGNGGGSVNNATLPASNYIVSLKVTQP